MSERRAVIIEDLDQLMRFVVRNERGSSTSLIDISYTDTWVVNGTGFDHGRKFHESEKCYYDVIIKADIKLGNLDVKAGNIIVEDNFNFRVRNLDCFDFESKGTLDVKSLNARNVEAKKVEVREGIAVANNITCEELKTQERLKVHNHLEVTEKLYSSQNIEAGSILVKEITFRDFCIATKGDIFYEKFTDLGITNTPYKENKIGLLASVWGETKKVDNTI